MPIRQEIIIYRSPYEAFWFDNPMLAVYLFIALACLALAIICVNWLIGKYREKKRFNHCHCRSFNWDFVTHNSNKK